MIYVVASLPDKGLIGILHDSAFSGKSSVVVGGIIPMGNLLVRLDFPLEVDYVHATRYGDELSGGKIKWLHYPKSDLKGRTVVIVEDVLDGGITLKHVSDYCIGQGSKQVKTVTLVDKEDGRVEGGIAKADYTGIVAENRFLFGYGMDYKGYLRNAPGIYALKGH